jgi:hypothetical membrane protein
VIEDRLAARDWLNLGSPQVAGVLFLLAGLVILMGIITAEAVYPDVYTTHENEISDLGATRPPNSIIRQPSATIFNSIMVVSGLLVLGGATALHRALHAKRATISIGMLGVGVLGVGVFPGNVELQHPIFALTAFLSAGIAAILSARVQMPPFSYVSIGLGVVILAALLVGLFGEGSWFFDELGDGGVERWIAYPAVLWLVAFGGYLMAPGGAIAQAAAE